MVDYPARRFCIEYRDMTPKPSHPQHRPTPPPAASETPTAGTKPAAKQADELDDAELEKLSGGGIRFGF